jgi:hypothetical protein
MADGVFKKNDVTLTTTISDTIFGSTRITIEGKDRYNIGFNGITRRVHSILSLERNVCYPRLSVLIK